jgi:MoaA/NifB/PqqE/SkfB family radical SAM enzyme
MKGTPYDFFVQWHLTCGAIDNVRSAFQSWVTEDDMQMSPSFHFTSGEPFLRKNLFEILAYVRDCGFSVSLMSNGTLIDSDMARRIKEAGISDVQISLDGLKATHEGLRGKGSFSRTLRGIGNLVAPRLIPISI